MTFAIDPAGPAADHAGCGEPGCASFTCPVCGLVSHHPIDISQGYCGRCHDFTGVPDDTARRMSATDVDRVRDLAMVLRADQDGVTEQVTLGPYTAYLLIAALQMAVCSPRVTADNAHRMFAIGEQLRDLFPPHLHPMITDGWGLELDRADREEQWPLPVLPATAATAKCPTCPHCGQPPSLLLAGGRQAFCGTDTCESVCWDPAHTPAHQIAHQQEIRAAGGGR